MHGRETLQGQPNFAMRRRDGLGSRAVRGCRPLGTEVERQRVALAEQAPTPTQPLPHFVVALVSCRGRCRSAAAAECPCTCCFQHAGSGVKGPWLLPTWKPHPTWHWRTCVFRTHKLRLHCRPVALAVQQLSLWVDQRGSKGRLRASQHNQLAGLPGWAVVHKGVTDRGGSSSGSSSGRLPQRAQQHCCAMGRW